MQYPACGEKDDIHCYEKGACFSKKEMELFGRFRRRKCSHCGLQALRQRSTYLQERAEQRNDVKSFFHSKLFVKLADAQRPCVSDVFLAIPETEGCVPMWDDIWNRDSLHMNRTNSMEAESWNHRKLGNIYAFFSCHQSSQWYWEKCRIHF